MTSTNNMTQVDKLLARKFVVQWTQYGKALTMSFHLKPPNLNSDTCKITASRKDSSSSMYWLLVALFSPWEASQDLPFWVKALEASETLLWHTFLAVCWSHLKYTTPWWINDFCQTYLTNFWLHRLHSVSEQNLLNMKHHQFTQFLPFLQLNLPLVPGKAVFIHFSNSFLH